MNRKDFIHYCGMLCLAGSIPAVLQGCVSAGYFARFSQNGNKLTLPKTEFVSLNKDKQEYRKFVLLKNDQFPFPLCVFRTDENTFTALYLECTHSGCELRPQNDLLVCPCHGSEFNNRGQVLNPPAEKDLRSFPVTHDSANIYILIS